MKKLFIQRRFEELAARTVTTVLIVWAIAVVLQGTAGIVV